jgi:hypothetical protein
MKSKKNSQAKNETKKTKKVNVSSRTKDKQDKKNVKSAAKKVIKPVVGTKHKSIKTASILPNKPTQKMNKSPKVFEMPSIFKDFYKEGDRIFLRNPKKFAGFPDLLDLQKRGYNDFIKKYINKLFGNINPVRDIA